MIVAQEQGLCIFSDFIIFLVSIAFCLFFSLNTHFCLVYQYVRLIFDVVSSSRPFSPCLLHCIMILWPIRFSCLVLAQVCFLFLFVVLQFDGLFSFVTVQFFVYIVCPSVPHQTLLRSRPCKRVVSKDIYYNLQAASFHLFVAKIDPF